MLLLPIIQFTSQCRNNHLFTDVDDHILLRFKNITIPNGRKFTRVRKIYHHLIMKALAFTIEQKINENLLFHSS